MSRAEREPQAGGPEALSDQLAADQYLTLQLPTGVDAEALALILDLHADMLPDTSGVGRILRELGEAVDAGTPVVREQIQAQERDAIDDTHRTRCGRASWDTRRFEDLWETYRDPDTGRHFELPYHWYHSAGRLADTELPWPIVRDQVHHTLTGPRPAYAAVMRACQDTLRWIRARAEREGST